MAGGAQTSGNSRLGSIMPTTTMTLLLLLAAAVALMSAPLGAPLAALATPADGNHTHIQNQTTTISQNQSHAMGTTGNKSTSDLNERLEKLKSKYGTDRAIRDQPYYCLLAVYSLLMLVGTIFNSLILFTVVLKPAVLSPRNIFIVNLAASDLLLCVFTMPFSFVEISMKNWGMGLVPCKLVAGLQATSIFVSTASITAIALDRYRVIINPTQHQQQESALGGSRRHHHLRCYLLMVLVAWLFALVLASPLFIFRTVVHYQLNPEEVEAKIVGKQSMDFCTEKWPECLGGHGRALYSALSMIFQYVLPITTVSFVYAKISSRLQKRLIKRQQQLTHSECKQKRQLSLIKRTHTMLVSVSLIFGLSWLPLNLLNLIGDFTDLFKGDNQQFRLVFAVCHLIGCLSACTNPILYAYLNDNFRKEALAAYAHHLNRLARLLRLKSARESSLSDLQPARSRRLLSQPAASAPPPQAPPTSSQQVRQSPPSSLGSSRSLASSTLANSSDATSATPSTSDSSSSSSSDSELLLASGARQTSCDRADRKQRPQWLAVAGGSHVVLNMDLGGLLKAPPHQTQADHATSPSSTARRCSYQTSAASSNTHRQLSSAVRLCLCISRASSIGQLRHSAESGAAMEAQQQQQPQVANHLDEQRREEVDRRRPRHTKCQCQCHKQLSASNQVRSQSASGLTGATSQPEEPPGDLRRRASKLLTAGLPLARLWQNAAPAVAANTPATPQRERARRAPCAACKANHRRRRRRRRHKQAAGPAAHAPSAERQMLSSKNNNLKDSDEGKQQKQSETGSLMGAQMTTQTPRTTNGARPISGGNNSGSNKPPTTTEASKDEELEEEEEDGCDCSHSSSIQASGCHLYSHSSSCTCSCRSTSSCPLLVQHPGGGGRPHHAPPATHPPTQIGSHQATSIHAPPLQRKVSWRARRQEQVTGGTCGCRCPCGGGGGANETGANASSSCCSASSPTSGPTVSNSQAAPTVSTSCSLSGASSALAAQVASAAAATCPRAARGRRLSGATSAAISAARRLRKGSSVSQDAAEPNNEMRPTRRQQQAGARLIQTPAAKSQEPLQSV